MKWKKILNTKLNKVDLASKWYLALLFLIIVIGFNMRYYHADYPSIGYHNMKEQEYLQEASVMHDTGDFIHTRVMWKGLTQDSYMQEALPLIPWLTAVSWLVLGKSLLWPRMLIIISSLVSLVLVYSITFRLSKNRYLGLVAALLFSFMPLGVFFGRNVQPDMPGLMLMLLFVHYFLIWLQTRKTKHIVLFSALIALAGLIKPTNLIALAFVMFLIPYRDIIKNHKKYLVPAGIVILILMSIPLWMVISKATTPTDYGIWSPRNTPLFEIFTKTYWDAYGPAIKNYAFSDNFTGWYLLFSALGLVFAALKHKTKFSRFLVGYLLSFIPYAIVVSTRLHQHSYYQLPYLPLVCMLSGYFIFSIGSIFSQIAKQFTKSKPIHVAASLLALLLILPTLPAVKASVNRQFDTQFIGFDVAGKYIHEHSQPDERVFLEGIMGGQGANLFGYANRFGTWMPKNLTDFKKGEDMGFSWVVLYNQAWQQGIDEYIFEISQKPDIWQYLQDNYQIMQVGIIGTGQDYTRVYMVLEKGGQLNESIITGQPELAQTYEYTYGTIDLYAVE